MSSSEGLDHRASAVLDFWTPGYRERKRTEAIGAWTALWFGRSAETDEKMTQHFKADVERMAAGENDHWLQHPYNALAGVILMDQFTRNIYRGTAKMYDLDEKARLWSKHIIESGLSKDLHPQLMFALALPFMHGETLEDQQRCIDIIQAEVDKLAPEGDAAAELIGMLRNCLQFGEKHKVVVKDWGRFPHRNAILGRANTPEEEAALKEGKIPSF